MDAESLAVVVAASDARQVWPAVAVEVCDGEVSGDLTGFQGAHASFRGVLESSVAGAEQQDRRVSGGEQVEVSVAIEVPCPDGVGPERKKPIGRRRAS